MRIDEGRPVDNETPAVKKKRGVEELTPIKAVQAYGGQAVQEAEKKRQGGHGQRRGGYSGHPEGSDETDLHGIDIDAMPAEARPVLIKLLDEIGHMSEQLHEAQQRIDYLEDRGGHDPNTGCLTRRAFLGALEQVLALDKENGIHSSLALVALPDWYRLRWEAGLDAAESQITRISEICERYMRTGDRLARIDDGVFAMVFVAAARAEADARLVALREDLAAETVEGKGLSVVDCLIELTDGHAQDILLRADQALVARWKQLAPASGNNIGDQA